MALDIGEMMPSVGADTPESEEQRKQRLLREAGGMSTMPAANVSELTPRGRELAIGATSQPRMPAARFEDAKAPEISGMPDSLRMPPDFARQALGSLQPAGGGSPYELPLDDPEEKRRRLANAALSGGGSMPAVNSPETEEGRPVLRHRSVPPVETPGVDVGDPIANKSTMPAAMTEAPAGMRANALEPGLTKPGFFTGAEEHPRTPSVQATTMPAVNVGPREKAYEDYAAQGRPGSPGGPQLSWWKKGLDIASQMSPIGRAIEQNIPGSPGNYDRELARRAMLAGREQKTGQEAADERRRAAPQHVGQFTSDEGHETEVSRDPQSGAYSTQTVGDVKDAKENATDKKVDEYTNAEGRRVVTFQRRNGSTYDHVGGKAQVRETGHTSPFEAFAYGSPDEKKAAQEFLTFERKLGRDNERPTEAEFRYSLYKRDPESYKAIFGEPKGNRPDAATATRMLNYFDRRRREVNGDFTLDDNQKQEQLREIENLQRPFMDAVQPGATGGGGDHGERVRVISPQGVEGTVPRSQLGSAKKKGYREAQ